MDFNDSPEEAAYREKAGAWLAENAAAHRAEQGEPKPTTPEHMAAAKAWQARKAAAGYACITWPAAVGGGGGTPIQSVIFGQEEAKAGVSYGYFTIGLGMCVPTVMAFADDATKQRLWAAFQRLPDRCRELLRVLIADPPLSYTEISAMFGIAIGSIGPTRGRCLRQLRELFTLEEELGGRRA